MRLGLDLDVTGRSVVVCGCSPASLGVLGDLSAAGAMITVCATSVPATIRDLAERSLITWRQRPWSPDDLAATALVVPADDDPAENTRIVEAARAAGRLSLSAPPSPGPRPAAGAGQVTLVGGGPGDPGLLTVAGLEAIKRADVIVCDRLAPLAALSQAPDRALVVDVAKIPRGEHTPQEKINDLLVEHARAGRRVVRLKGGDSFVFGRGGEELLACAAAGIPVTVIPGVSSATAAPALAGIPLTHRSLTQGVTIVSAHLPPGYAGSTLDWAAIARSNTTLVIMMGVATLPEVSAELIAQGMDPTTPAATIADAGLPSQRTVRATLATIAAATLEGGLRPPAVTVIGAVAGFDA
ncbi:MAG TPA: uroporphyrinogen-III C-methyltransferase [Candidatus Nanopelagicales bacterium]|nr:uroporphyrinogen-III C-methyltransferase [Candidatus Nanopelagicales bacterium]